MRVLQLTSLGCLGSLLLLTAIRQLVMDPLPNTAVNVSWLVIQVLPLLAVAPGVFRLRITGYFFAVMVGMLYFVHGVQASFGPTERSLDLWGIFEAFLSVALVGFASYAIRALRAR